MNMQFRYASIEGAFTFGIIKLRSRNVCWIRLYINRLYIYARV